MRNIITSTFITLDGVMQAPDKPEEGFPYGGWYFGGEEETDGESDKISERLWSEPFDMLLGRRTYDVFAAFWPQHKDIPLFGKAYDSAKKYVVSTKAFPLSWNNSELITGDVVTEIKKLKNSDGPDLGVWGSGNLIQTLLKHNLIDRMHVMIFPVTIGTGKKLFGEGTRPERFKQIEAKILSNGVIFATYKPSEPLKKS